SETRAGRDVDVLPLRLAVEESSFPPSGEQVGPPVTGTVGEPVSLSCMASGSPVPHMSWVLPDGNIVRRGLAVSGGRVRRLTVFDNGTLLVPAVGMGEEGDRSNNSSINGYSDNNGRIRNFVPNTGVSIATSGFNPALRSDSHNGF
uniref:Ig-like domain-containing protein n=1 Tax=Sparus aurata TaxID=8175 RepID=A0A671Z4D8_SPAAU